MTSRSRRGDMFLFMLNIFFLIAIILIFSKLHAAFTIQNEGEGIGTRQAALLHTYAMSEQMLLYVDEAAKFAAYESLATTMEHGADNLAMPRCPEKYAGYSQWTRANAPDECFPGGNSASANQVYESFKKEMQVNLRKYLAQYPGFPAGVTYEIILEQDDGLRVIGITRDQITFPIVAVKDARQQAITPFLRQDSVAKTTLEFSPDTTLRAEIAPSVNSKPRIAKPANITIQATLTADAVTARKQYLDGRISTHYLIDEQGTLTQVIPEDQRAFLCEEPGCARIEESSIIISLVNQGAVVDQLEGGACKSKEFELLKPTWCAACTQSCYETYTKEQFATLEALLVDIIQRTGMPVQNINLREQLLDDGNPGPALRAGPDQRQWLADVLTRVAAKSRAPSEVVEDVASASSVSNTASVTAGAAMMSDLGVMLPLDNAQLTSCFGKRNLAGHENHGGIDFAVPIGTPIRAIADGTVKQQCDDCPGTRGFGKNILITHPNGMLSHYSHLSVINVQNGQQVKRGEIIGLSGNTGSSTGPHLHFAIFTHDVSAPLSREASNALCVFPDEQLARIKGKPYNCLFAEMSHNDPDFNTACTGVTAMKSVPSCGLNSMPLSAAGDAELTAVLAKVEKLGLMPILEHAEKESLVDKRLLVAQIAKESSGRHDIVTFDGGVGIAQFTDIGVSKESFQGIGDTSRIKACKCPGGKGYCTPQEAACDLGDPRLDPAMSIRAQARLISKDVNYYKEYTDKIQFAFAAYNAGNPGMDIAIKKAKTTTGKEDPRWEEVSPYLPAVTQKYVPGIMQLYAAQGGSVETAFSDMECNNFNVKEMGTYSFAPAFTVTVPDLLTAVDRTATWAKETYTSCDDETASCLQERIETFNRGSADLGIVQCEEAPQAALMELQQVLLDCQQNRQDACACAWKPRTTEEVRIQLTGSRGIPQASLFTPPADTHGEFKTGLVKQGQANAKAIILTTGTNTITLSEPDGSDPQTFTVDEFRFLKTASGIVLTLDNEPFCGDYKTTYPVCVQVKQPIPILSKGSELETPKIKFALWLNDRHAPAAVDQGTATPAGLVFMASDSDDVSYYLVGCGIGTPGKPVFINGRNDGRVVAQLAMQLCDGMPFIPTTTYAVSIAAIDMSGNMNTQLFTTAEGVLVPQGPPVATLTNQARSTGTAVSGGSSAIVSSSSSGSGSAATQGAQDAGWKLRSWRKV